MKTSLTGPGCYVQRKTFRFSKVRTLFFLNGPPSQYILIISIYFSLKKNSWFYLLLQSVLAFSYIRIVANFAQGD